MNHRLADFAIDLRADYPPSEWEKVADILAHALYLAGYAGSIEDDTHDHATAIRDLSRESSAVAAVDWNAHVRGPLFCPTCGDTLFCNQCGREARGSSNADGPTDNAANAEWLGGETPLTEVLDDHPIEGIDD